MQSQTALAQDAVHMVSKRSHVLVMRQALLQCNTALIKEVEPACNNFPWLACYMHMQKKTQGGLHALQSAAAQFVATSGSD